MRPALFKGSIVDQRTTTRCSELPVDPVKRMV